MALDKVAQDVLAHLGIPPRYPAQQSPTRWFWAQRPWRWQEDGTPESHDLPYCLYRLLPDWYPLTSQDAPGPVRYSFHLSPEAALAALQAACHAWCGPRSLDPPPIDG